MQRGWIARQDADPGSVFGEHLGRLAGFKNWKRGGCWVMVHQFMARLGLTPHPGKTRVLDARQHDFAFLGHTHRWRFNRLYHDVGPKASRRIREELRRKTRRTGLSLVALIADLNPSIRGARYYGDDWSKHVDPLMAGTPRTRDQDDCPSCRSRWRAVDWMDEARMLVCGHVMPLYVQYCPDLWACGGDVVGRRRRPS